MKSKFFKDTQGLESAFESCTPDKVSVCLRLSRTAYELGSGRIGPRGPDQRRIHRAPHLPARSPPAGGRRLGQYSTAVVHR